MFTSYLSSNVDWIGVLSCSLSFCIYLNTLNAGFVYDDSRAILTNKDVLQQETPWNDIWKDDFWGTPLSHSGSHKSFRPLTILSFRANRWFSGFNPWSYHLVNVLLHTLTTWLFVRVARIVFNLSDRIQHSVFHTNNDLRSSDTECPTANQNLALLVSSHLFASHPIHTEAVAGVVGRADVGATAFALSSFLLYTRHVKWRGKCKIHRHRGGEGDFNNPSEGDKRDSSIDTSISSNPFPCYLRSGLYFVIAIALASASLLSKEHGIMIIFICAAYDIITSLLICRQNQKKLTSFRELECSSSIIMLGLSLVALFNLRLNVMGDFSPPQFAKADNPTAQHPSFWVRMMTFLYLPIFNLSLMVYPHPLSYDWSMEAVSKVEKITDPRNLLTLLFYTALLRSIYRSTIKVMPEVMFSTPQSNKTNKKQTKKAGTPPLNNKNPSCRICRFTIFNHKCTNNGSNNNNSIHVRGSEADAMEFESVNGHTHHHHHHHYQHSTPSSSASSVSNQHFNKSRHPSHVSPKRPNSTNSSSGSGGGMPQESTESQFASLDHGSYLLQMAFLIIPFLPASNLFLYVGFVVAERVLYFPSVGFCLLVGHGFSQLYIKSDKCRKGKAFVKALLVAAFVATVVMMSLGTTRRNEDWKDEGQLYRAGIAVNPPKSWGNLGNVLNSQGRLTEAEEAYRQALRFRPNMAEVHYNLGLVLERQGKVEDALTSYRTAIHFRQQLASAYVNAGQLLTRLGRINQAMDMYRNCFNLNDSGVKDLRTHVEAKVSALLRFGKLLIENDDAPKAAVNVYRQAVRIMPVDYEQKQSVYNAIGEALFRIGEVAEAESWFLEALKTKPDHVPAHLTYGKMLARNKTRLLEAERWFRRAKKIAPQDSSVYHHYGQFLAVQGRHAEAATAYVTAASLSPNDYDIVVGAANALRQSGNNKEAEIYYEKAVALRSQEARAHMNLGAILHVNGKYHEAEQSYLMALRLKPSDDVTLLNLKKLRQLQARRGQFAMSCKGKSSKAMSQPHHQPQKQLLMSKSHPPHSLPQDKGRVEKL